MLQSPLKPVSASLTAAVRLFFTSWGKNTVSLLNPPLLLNRKGKRRRGRRLERVPSGVCVCVYVDRVRDRRVRGEEGVEVEEAHNKGKQSVTTRIANHDGHRKMRTREQLRSEDTTRVGPHLYLSMAHECKGKAENKKAM